MPSLTVTVDGESVRTWVDLETASKPAARRKVARLVADQSVPSVEALNIAAARAETVSEAAARILVERDGVRDIENDRIRFRLHIKPHIGTKATTAVKSSDIRDVLDEAKGAGKSRRTVVHIRRTMSLIFETLWRDEALPENPVARVRVPSMAVDKRERSVLTGEELARYLGWEHPEEHHRMGVLERQTMACVSRLFGGVRTGDIHAIRWEAVDTEGGQFRFGWAPRKKTARPQLLEIPEMLRPILRDWWERAGRPSAGLVFPARRGEHAGLRPKQGVSHAEAFRRDLQALADAGASAQQAQALAGHASLDAHARYLNNTAKMRVLPEAALPKLLVLPRALPKLPPANAQAEQATKAKTPVVAGAFFQLRGGDTQRGQRGFPCRSR